jgi:hypothetical protein
MYVNAKMIPVEIIPGMRGGIMERDSGGELEYDILIHCKTHNILSSSTTLKEK